MDFTITEKEFENKLKIDTYFLFEALFEFSTERKFILTVAVDILGGEGIGDSVDSHIMACNFVKILNNKKIPFSCKEKFLENVFLDEKKLTEKYAKFVKERGLLGMNYRDIFIRYQQDKYNSIKNGIPIKNMQEKSVIKDTNYIQDVTALTKELRELLNNKEKEKEKDGSKDNGVKNSDDSIYWIIGGGTVFILLVLSVVLILKK